MSTVAVWNGYGKYETKDKEQGITLNYGGKPFWFPFEQITYLPDFTMREVDHAKSTAEAEGEGHLTYLSFRVSGQRLAEELLMVENPIKNEDKGIMIVPSDESKRTGQTITIFAGVSDDGQTVLTEVAEVEALPHVAQVAAKKAYDYKKEIIQQYFQSKRERMAGGPGQIFPRGLVKVYMEELGVQDIDDVSEQMNAKKVMTQIGQALSAQATAVPAPIVTQEMLKPPALIVTQEMLKPPGKKLSASDV